MGAENTRLTLGPEQTRRLARSCAPWRSAAALDCAVDMSLAEWALVELYTSQGLRCPPVVWVDSPGEAARVIGESGAHDRELLPTPSEFVNGCSPGGSVQVMPGDQGLIEALGWVLGEDVGESALLRIAEELGLALVSWYAPPAECTEGCSVQTLLSESLRLVLRARPEVPQGWCGAWSAAQWVGFYDVLQELGLLQVAPFLERHLGILADLARSGCGWWWPYRDLCVVSRRPVAMATEERLGKAGGTRLHCADGPALTFADGWTCHAWRGMAVPGDLVEEGWPAERILAEPDREIRRCAVERIGWAEFLDEAGVPPAHPPVADPAVPGGTLTLYELPEGMMLGRTRVLVFTDEKGRRRGWETSFPYDDPIEAAAWKLRLKREQYPTVNLTTGRGAACRPSARPPAPARHQPVAVRVARPPSAESGIAVPSPVVAFQ